MNNRKNQNSILVLATLGVYLGLVLAGATPQVLAQAATAKQFSVKDEIEFKDDLDKKPDAPVLADSIETYFFHIESFLDGLRDLRKRGKYHVGRDTFEFSNLTILPCSYDERGLKWGLADRISIEVKNSKLWKTVASFRNRLNSDFPLADCLPSTQLEGKTEAQSSSTNVQFDLTTFSIELGLKKRSTHSAVLLTGRLTSAISQWDMDDVSPIREQLITNTSFRHENDQVFIVTRLPRAGLDTLLATDAK